MCSQDRFTLETQMASNTEAYCDYCRRQRGRLVLFSTKFCNY